MDLTATLNATPRTMLGKGPARQLRREGLIPAVFYGNKTENRNLAVNSKELKSVAFADKGSHSIFKLQIDVDGTVEEKLVMLKDHQIDPLKRTLVHVDFYEVDASRSIEILVPLVLLGKPEGVEKGGMLQQIRREITIKALPHSLPDQIEVDVSALDLGESLHVADVNVPEGMEVVYDVNFTLATLIAPKGAQTEEGAEEEGAEEDEE